jgi:CrcB protein
MQTLKYCLAIGVAGFLGALARFWVSALCGRVFETSFPVGTLVINISGSFVLGLFLTLVGDRMTVSETTRLAIAVGFLGAYTTFSTLMYESTALLERGERYKAAANLFLSFFLGLLAVRLGAVCARRL